MVRVATINSKQEWPDCYPVPEMLARRPDIVPMLVPLQSGMGIPGGPRSPIAARGLYLWQNNKDTLYRIHGTNEPHTIGHSVSSGCIRMINQERVSTSRMRGRSRADRRLGLRPSNGTLLTAVPASCGVRPGVPPLSAAACGGRAHCQRSGHVPAAVGVQSIRRRSGCPRALPRSATSALIRPRRPRRRTSRRNPRRPR